MLPLHQMTEHDIERAVASTASGFGELYATAGERAIPVGSTIYGLSDFPCTVTRVRGRRFIWVTSDRHPEPHLIDWTAFTTADGERIVDVVDRAARPGEGR